MSMTEQTMIRIMVGWKRSGSTWVAVSRRLRERGYQRAADYAHNRAVRCHKAISALEVVA